MNFEPFRTCKYRENFAKYGGTEIADKTSKSRFETGKSTDMTDDKQLSRQRLKIWCAMALLECHEAVHVKDLQSVILTAVDDLLTIPSTTLSEPRVNHTVEDTALLRSHLAVIVPPPKSRSDFKNSQILTSMFESL